MTCHKLDALSVNVQVVRMPWIPIAELVDTIGRISADDRKKDQSMLTVYIQQLEEVKRQVTSLRSRTDKTDLSSTIRKESMQSTLVTAKQPEIGRDENLFQNFPVEDGPQAEGSGTSGHVSVYV
jgi:hypothetical protein